MVAVSASFEVFKEMGGWREMVGMGGKRSAELFVGQFPAFGSTDFGFSAFPAGRHLRELKLALLWPP